MACSRSSDDCSDGELENRKVYINSKYRTRQGPFRRQRKYSDFQNDDFPEEDVFKKLVLSGGLSSVSQYIEENVPEETFNRWLKGRRTKLLVYMKRNKPICIGPFLKEATLCFDHTSRNCRRLNCSHFHICSFYLNDICKRGRNCKKGHDFDDDHNQHIIENLELEKFPEKEIKTIILCRYPQVCRSETCALREDCPYLHICYNFLKNKCEFANCTRGHSFDTPHNNWVLKSYRMERWSGEKLALLKALINMPRHQKQIDYSNQYTHFDYNSESEDMSTSNSTKDYNGHKKDICLDHLVGTCRTRACDKHHTNLPYLWQIHFLGEWLRFDEEENQSLEKRYCNMRSSAKGKIFSKGSRKEITLNFKEKYDTCTGESDSLQYRRLSTASFATENAPLQKGSFHTQWRWYFTNDNRQWIPFDKDELQYTLEKKYVTGQKYYLFIRESHDHKLKYRMRISFADLKQKNLDTRTVRKILRRPVFVSRTDIVSRQFPKRLDVVLSDPHPPEWNALDLAHDFELVELDEKLTEFIDVKTAFFAKLDEKIIKICNIYRIQNLPLWNEYRMKKIHLEKTHAKKTGRLDERTLFHGTDSYDTCYGICTNSFDFRLSGKNATVYGKGSYFAASAKYSHNYTRGPVHLMFQAKVLIGRYTKGSGDMTCPPNIPGEGHRRYDSCVDKTSNPSIFVVFDRNQCYPEYLIAYQSKSTKKTAAAVQNRYQAVTNVDQSVLGRTTRHTGTSIASTDTPGEPLNSVTNTSPPVSTTLQSTSSVLSRVVSQTFENPGSNVAGRMKNGCTIQ
nr:protein mono-ADP-ribosyltransferase PARP12-like [Crassostrea gigas]